MGELLPQSVLARSVSLPHLCVQKQRNPITNEAWKRDEILLIYVVELIPLLVFSLEQATEEYPPQILHFSRSLALFFGFQMDPPCDLCGVKKAIVYCQSDNARLCLSCDECIHSANALSCRHLRSLICNGCGSKPAVIRCLDDKLSLCDSCQATSCKDEAMAAHQRRPVNFYSECPSLEELSQLWSSAIDPEDLKEGDASWSQGREGTNGNYMNDWMQMKKGSYSITLGDLDSSHLVPNVNLMASGGEQHVPGRLKVSSAPSKDTAQLNGVDDFDLGFGMGDMDFNSGRYDMLGCAESEPRYQSEDKRMDCLFIDNSFSMNNLANENVLEDGFGLQSSHVPGAAGTIRAVGAGADRVLFKPFAGRNFSHGYPTIQTQSNMSFPVSNHSGETSATDYQDCEVSPRFLTEVPWDSNIEAPSPQARDKAKIRYHEKKKTRSFTKQIRYAARKERADSRKRVNGRFMKTNEA